MTSETSTDCVGDTSKWHQPDSKRKSRPGSGPTPILNRDNDKIIMKRKS